VEHRVYDYDFEMDFLMRMRRKTRRRKRTRTRRNEEKYSVNERMNCYVERMCHALRKKGGVLNHANLLYPNCPVLNLTESSVKCYQPT
jgi:hypothetical protein